MLRVHRFKSNSPRKRQEVANLLFLPNANHRLLATALVLILLISGCGNNEEITDGMILVETEPNYYPMSVGSRWVYRNPDGSEWTREVTETEFITSRKYQIFSYSPQEIINWNISTARRTKLPILIFFCSREMRRAA